MFYKVLLAILISSPIPSTLGILRPKPDFQPESELSRQGVSRPIVNPPPPPRNNQPQQLPQQIGLPSRDLLPPLVSPQGPVVTSNALPPQRLPQSNSFLETPGSSEKIELLPPVEIPPAFPIDGNDNNVEQGNALNGDNQQVAFQASDAIDQFALPGRQQTSFFPTTGSGSSGGSFSNQIPIPDFRQSPPQGQPQLNVQTTTSPSQTTRDSGADCLGTCECPGDFTFVCGSNRFLYQNECALECDKKCHPDLIKVSMTHCS